MPKWACESWWESPETQHSGRSTSIPKIGKHTLNGSYASYVSWILLNSLSNSFSPLTRLRNKRSISIGPNHAIQAPWPVASIFGSYKQSTYEERFDGPKSYYLCISHHIFLQPFQLLHRNTTVGPRLRLLWLDQTSSFEQKTETSCHTTQSMPHLQAYL